MRCEVRPRKKCKALGQARCGRRWVRSGPRLQRNVVRQVDANLLLELAFGSDHIPYNHITKVYFGYTVEQLALDYFADLQGFCVCRLFTSPGIDTFGDEN